MLELSIENEINRFEKYLDDTSNNRVIFSGKFRSGKTYFLQKFFTKNAESYINIRISPINYQLSENEDIFKLIKYDILAELFVKYELVPPEKEIPKSFILAKILNKTGNEFLKVFKLFDKRLEKLIDLGDKLDQFFSEIKDASDDYEEIKNFANRIDNTPGLEFDYVSEFIEDSLQALCDDDREKVLIIDDLDRIDPEHLFRILNIFSAHLDFRSEDENKFGFDKLIFVCDYDNLRNIYAHKYGIKTDFDGYIKKFNSNEIFHLDNSKELNSIIVDFIASIGTEKDFLEYYNDPATSNLLAAILSGLIESNQIQIGLLKNKYNHHFNYTVKLIKHPSLLNNISNWNIRAVFAFEFFEWLVDDNTSLSNYFENTKEYFTNSNFSPSINVNIIILVQELLALSEIRKHGCLTNQNTTYEAKLNSQKIRYNVNKTGIRHNIIYCQLEDRELQKFNFFELVSKAYNEYRNCLE